MYLPMSLTLLIPIAALLGRLYDRWAEGQAAMSTEEAAGGADGHRG